MPDRQGATPDDLGRDHRAAADASHAAVASVITSATPWQEVEPRARFTPRERLTLALLAAVFAIHFLDRQLLAILIPPIKTELGLSDTALGLLSGFAFAVLFSVAGLVIARIADRSNRARIITWSLVVFSGMTALCGVVTNFWQLALARIGVGAGEGGTNPASHSLIADTFHPSHRTTAMAVYSIGPNVGLVLAFGIGGWLAQTAGWRAAFFAAGALGLLVAIATRFGLRDEHARTRVALRDAAPPPLEAARAMFASRAMRHLVAGGTLATAAATGLVTWLPALFTRVHEWSLAQAGLFLAVVLGVLGAGGTYGFGRRVDRVSAGRLGPKALAVARLEVGLAVLIPVGLLADTGLGAAVLLGVPCLLVAAYIGPNLSLVQDLVDPRSRAFCAALLLLCVNLAGAGVGPLAVGALSDTLAADHGRQSLRYAMLVVPVLCAWSALHFWLSVAALEREGRR